MLRGAQLPAVAAVPVQHVVQALRDHRVVVAGVQGVPARVEPGAEHRGQQRVQQLGDAQDSVGEPRVGAARGAHHDEATVAQVGTSLAGTVAQAPGGDVIEAAGEYGQVAGRNVDGPHAPM